MRSATGPSARALDAIEAARAANGWNDARHHIAHIQLPDPDDLPRLRRLGVVSEPAAVLGTARSGDRRDHDAAGG